MYVDNRKGTHSFFFIATVFKRKSSSVTSYVIVVLRVWNSLSDRDESKVHKAKGKEEYLETEKLELLSTLRY